jgi:hypothetical protein
MSTPNCDEFADPAPEQSDLFGAAFDGSCSCGTQIIEGDDVGYVAGELLCENCYREVMRLHG